MLASLRTPASRALLALATLGAASRAQTPEVQYTLMIMDPAQGTLTSALFTSGLFTFATTNYKQPMPNASSLTWTDSAPRRLYAGASSSGQLKQYDWEGRTWTFNDGKSGTSALGASTSLSVFGPFPGGEFCLYATDRYGAAFTSQALRSTTTAEFNPGDLNPSAVPDITRLLGRGGDPVLQAAPHPLDFLADEDLKFFYLVDYGTDTIRRYVPGGPRGACDLVPTENLNVQVDKRDGPVGLAFWTDTASGQKYAYVSTELGGTLRAYTVDAQGGFTRIEEPLSLRPSDGKFDYGGYLPGDIAISPDGRYIWVSMRHFPGPGPSDWIALAHRLPSGGFGGVEPQYFQSGGRNPVKISLSRDGLYLAVANAGAEGSPGPQEERNVVVQQIDPASGLGGIIADPIPFPGPSFVRWWG